MTKGWNANGLRVTSDGIRRRYGFVVVLVYVDGEIDDYLLFTTTIV